MFFKAIEKRAIQALDIVFMNNHDELELRRDFNSIAICSESYLAVIFSIEVSVALIKKLIKTLVNAIEIGKNEDCTL